MFGFAFHLIDARARAIASAIATVVAVPAFAADLPTAKPAPAFVPPPIFSWTGFYAGINAGAAWNNGGNVTIFDPTIPATRVFGVGSTVAFIGGGQLGFNYQIGAFVWGIETDIQGLTAGGKSINVGPYGFLHIPNNTNGGWLGTARGRLGYAIDRTLLYVTGGVAYGGFNNNPLNNSGNATSNVGYAVGGGVEYAFDRHWTVKLEGLYVNLNAGSKTINIVNGGNVYTVTGHPGNGGGIVRAGVNYLF
jgi:outer membrane immunogenic protein